MAFDGFRQVGTDVGWVGGGGDGGGGHVHFHELDREERIAFIDLRARGEQHFLDAAGLAGAHLVLHLHRLEYGQERAGADPIARGHGHREQLA